MGQTHLIFLVFNCFLFPSCRKPSLKSRPQDHEETQVAWGRSVAATICLSHLFSNILYNRLNKPRQNIGALSTWLKTSIDIKWKGDPLFVANYYRFASRQHAIQNNNLYPWWEKGPCFATKIPVFVMLSLFSHPLIVRFFSSC